ncbi:MAG: type II secretion system F family protein [Oscillospiraceae bacterium]|nr:type II secretion system F family protein [Oscillospiraceae bacterium]
MKKFVYIAKDTSGKTIKGAMEAETREEVNAKIYDQGWFPVKITADLGKGVSGMHKFTTKELSFCCRQLSAMMSSGLTIVKALDILYKQMNKKDAQQTWLDVYESVQKGATFTEALQEKNGAFPEFFISMIGAGESSGTLDTVMARLQDHYAKENRTTNKIKGAMTYPIVLAVLCVVMVIGMFTLILPNFRDMGNEEDMSIITKALFAFSDFVIEKWWLLIIIVAVVVFAIVYGLKIKSVRLKYDEIKLKMPKVGKLIKIIYTGRFARTMSSLYSSGIPMVECLERSSKILGNSYVDEAFIQIVDEVKQGQPLSTSIQKTEVFDPMFCSIVYVGEESGALDEILSKTADYYEEESDSAIERLVGLMEPLMIVIMGCAIGLCLAGIFPLLYGGMDIE